MSRWWGRRKTATSIKLVDNKQKVTNYEFVATHHIGQLQIQNGGVLMSESDLALQKLKEAVKRYCRTLGKSEDQVLASCLNACAQFVEE